MQKKNNIPREVAMRDYGVADLSSTGTQRLDHRFILFDNFVVEPLKYSDGLTFGGEGFNPTLKHSTSPSYIGQISAAFGGFKNGSKFELEDYIDKILKPKLKRHGYQNLVKLPAGIARFEADHPFHGLSYGYMKGPDGEAIQLVDIKSTFKSSLQLAYKFSSGTVTTMFEETNPFMNGDMKDFCNQL